MLQKTPESPLDSKEIKPVNLKINPEYSLEGLMLKLNEPSTINVCLVVQWCPTLCNPVDSSTPGLPVPHHPPKFAQIHAHCIHDAIQPSHPLMLSSLSALNVSQHQGRFQWVN